MKLVTTKFRSVGLHEKHVVALGKLGTTSAFAFRPRETKINLCREERENRSRKKRNIKQRVLIKLQINKE
jgi:hypothetical protein